jgi:GNAT superfamily N-acetyltransferase
MAETATGPQTVIVDLNARLPKGYRARAFEEPDREPIVAAGNSETSPMEHESAEEWRHWERMIDDPARLRVIVVGPDGKVAGTGALGVGMMPRADGAQFLGQTVFKEHRRRGVGSAVLQSLEAEVRRRGVPRLLAGVSAAKPFAVEFAKKRGYTEIGRRILSYRELASYAPAQWRESLERVTRQGIVFRTFGEIVGALDEAGQARFWRDLWEAEGPMWDDIPFASPIPHWPFEQFLKMSVNNPQIIRDLSLVAYDGETIVGFTMTGDRQGKDGNTFMTGVARTHRGKGIAMALKVDVLARAKARGLRAMTTVNDEPNKAMRGVNIKLGYQAVPDHIELEKNIEPTMELDPLRRLD